MTSDQVIRLQHAITGASNLDQIVDDVARTVALFRAQAFPSGFGFDAFEIDDVINYFCSEDHYNLSLRKVRGQGVLYGTIHASLRRQFFNDLPLQARIDVVLPKMRHFNIDVHLRDFVGMRSRVPILDVEDIGMGHSVYRLSTAHGEVVVKQEDVPNQQFYMEFQRALGYPWFRSQHYVGKRTWELTDYLGPTNLNDVLVNNGVSDWDGLIDQLARHAAMGDVLGREDRHFENYVVRGNSILPVDTSMLFGDGNEQWSERYIAGGLYEICVLSQFVEDEGLFSHYFSRFQFSYMAQCRMLTQSTNAILRLIAEFFDEDRDLSYRCSYVRQRLENKDYPILQFHRYRSGMEEMMRRRVIRMAIQRKVLAEPEVLDRSPILKMYYLADQGRVSTLFLLELHRQQVEDALETNGIILVQDQVEMESLARRVTQLDWGKFS